MNSEFSTSARAIASRTLAAEIRCTAWRWIALAFFGLTLIGPVAAQPPAKAPQPAPPPTDPVVQALLATKPTTPSELLQAAKILVDLEYPDIARPMIDRLLAQKLDDAALVALDEEFGAALLLRLADVTELKPAAGALADKILAAVNRTARAPARIAELIDQLTAEASDAQLAAAIRGLRPGRDAAATALATALADPARAANRAEIRLALVALASDATGPLLALLETAKPEIAVQAVQALGQIRDPVIGDYLFAAALAPDAPAELKEAGRRALVAQFGEIPNSQQAAARLRDHVRALLKKMYAPHGEPKVAAGLQSTLWRWDAAKNKLTAETVTPEVAEAVAAIRLAGDALRIPPTSQTLRRLLLVAQAQGVFDADATESKALHVEKARQALAATSVDDLNELLEFAMAEGYPAAAAEAARYLGASGDPHLLNANTPQPSALVKALQHPDRRLRFAALAAIMALDPDRGFPGAGRVTEALDYFARSSGTPKALIVASHTDEATRLAGLAGALGYEAEYTIDGAAGARLAQLLGDFEFAIVDMAVGGATSGQFLQRLRVDPRSAELPVLLQALEDEVPAAERLARLVPPSVAVVRPISVEGLEYELKLLDRATNRAIVSREERTAECAQALRWIGRLADRPRSLYELRRLDAAVLASLDAPGVTELALAALARLDTARSQRALAEVASRQAAPIEIRRLAANAFGESVLRCGTLLTVEQVVKQYERYNASRTADAETQKVFASILDTIEARAAGEAVAAGREPPVKTTEP
ncbi:MAG TPA: hypothetical protein VGJ26_05615 [Pirellulales bacterium]|jgi:hypothetical protein